MFIHLLITLLLSTGSARAENVYASSYNSNTKHDDGVDYDTFVQKIKAADARTLEQALELVPKEFYDNYVLMYRSRSLQDSNYLFPRAIVFGRSAKFIMAFNGHEKQRGYSNLEIVQFREDTHRWEFREITFNGTDLPSFSEANPKKCLECHQSPKRVGIDPRPNWEPYNFWPGAYASVDSTIKPTLKPDYEDYVSKKKGGLYGVLDRFLPQDMVLLDEQAQEEQSLRRFTDDIKPRHGRYKFLGTFNERGPLNLTKSTVILNMRRVARLLREELGDLFGTYKYALFGLGDGDMMSSKNVPFRCSNLYMPDSVREKHIALAQPEKKFPERQYKKPNSYSFSWKHGFAAGIEIALAPLGIMTDDWSMDFRTDGRFSFVDRFTSPHDSRTHFRDAINIVYAGDPDLLLGCKQLEAESEKRLKAFEASGELDKKLLSAQQVEHKASRPLIERCISCHVDSMDGGQAPYLPFDDFSRLEPLLAEEKYPRGTLFEEILYRTGDHAPLKHQMPPSGVVDRTERDKLIESLRGLL